MPRCAVVVVTHNSSSYLEKCLRSCLQHAGDAQLVVVDNASTDGSAELARSTALGATCLTLRENLGFAAGCNVGVGAAMGADAEFVLLLNPDAELTPGALDLLVEFLDRAPEAAAAQPAVMLPDGRVNSMGNRFHFLGYGYAGGNGMSLDQATARLPWLVAGSVDPVEVPYCSGAAMLLRVDALRALGGLEEELFLYQEDLEICLRYRLCGGTVHLVPAASVIHHYAFGRTRAKWYYLERNRSWVWMAYLRKRTLGLLAVPWVAAEAATWAVALRGGWATDKARAYGYWTAPRSRRYLAQRRRALQAMREVTDRELLAPATGEIGGPGFEGRLFTRFLNPVGRAVWSFLYGLIRW